MSDSMHPLLTSAAGMTAVLLAGWAVQLRSRNASTADVLWSFCLSGAALFYACTGSGSEALRLTIGLLAGIWYARLGTHLLFRVVREEDGRYRAMRGHWGRRANLQFLWFFLAQALMAWLFALPFWVVANNPEPFRTLHAAALLIAAIALLGESVADEQLRRFKNDPANGGKTCRSGLWRYSRHPNYFFEWLHWLAYPLLATGSVYALWVWLAPLAMLAFLLLFTGIPYTERRALQTRGDDYRDYQRRTSSFILWPPKP